MLSVKYAIKKFEKGIYPLTSRPIQSSKGCLVNFAIKNTRLQVKHISTNKKFNFIILSLFLFSFLSQGSLRRHEKIHMDLKEHKCRFCGKGFVQKANMQAHERIHTGERPYKCQHCNEGFVQLTRKKQHESTCKMKWKYTNLYFMQQMYSAENLVVPQKDFRIFK